MPRIQDTSAQDRVISQRGLNRSTVFVIGFIGLALVGSIPFYTQFQSWFTAETSFARARLRFARVERRPARKSRSRPGRHHSAGDAQ